MVVTTLPLADVLLPGPQVGKARSFILSGAKTPTISYPVGFAQTAPTEKFWGVVVGQ